MSYRIKIVKEPKKENPPPVQYSLSCAFVGDAGVGKTSTIKKLVDREGKMDLATVAFDYFNVVLPLKAPYAETTEEPRVALEIADTSGQERYRSFVYDSLRGVPVVIIMYDCQNAATFGENGSRIMEHHNKIKKANEWSHVMVVLMAGKAERGATVAVPHKEAKKFAQLRGWLFMKSSVRENSVAELQDKFSRIATAALERHWGRSLDELWAPFVEAPYVIYKYISE